MRLVDSIEPVVMRDYQNAMMAKTDALFDRGVRSVFEVAPPGAGKTNMFCHRAKKWRRAGRKVLITEHRSHLVEQASQTLTRHDVEHGIIQGCDSTNPFASVQLVSIDSMKTRELPFKPDDIIVDEAHLGKAMRYTRLYDRFPDARRLLESGSPTRLDGQGFDDVCEHLVVGPTVKDLLTHPDGPFLVPAQMFDGKNFGDIDATIGIVADDFNQGQLERYFCRDEVVEDVVQKYLLRAQGRTGTVYGVSKRHIRILCDAFNQAGVISEFIDEGTQKGERRDILARLARAQTMLVMNCNILTEGLDEPSIRYVGLAYSSFSFAKYYQSATRGMRPSPGKKDCIVNDHGQNFDRFGIHVHDEIPWSLHGLGKFRKIPGAAAKCKNCGAFLARDAHICDVCGYKRIFIAGVETFIPIRTEPLPDPPLVQKYRLLLRWAMSKGKHPTVAYNAIKSEFGEVETSRELNRRKLAIIFEEEGIT